MLLVGPFEPLEVALVGFREVPDRLLGTARLGVDFENELYSYRPA